MDRESPQDWKICAFLTQFNRMPCFILEKILTDGFEINYYE